MGYYVEYEGTITIPAERERDIFHALRGLNKLDYLKRGGSWSGGGQTEKWFSWMPSDVNEWGDTAWEILHELGFNFDGTDDTRRVWYDNKTGQEELFLQALVRNGGTVDLECRGEDGYVWKYTTENDNLVTKTGRIVYD